eukprot:CAMPEP_0115452276 /NCGR_PEP_ID=MMETSP0271-20121206/42509_1 /TAXON_ID=71861 /ORGANISM="Scrippsiella trochoidea, Strain CCMP3099" /LENGTH=390 /DNA_ID=CAMNT_0002878595 /DNA_START=133 /DNA_END=1307 /DNA_ORIENTATION=-
MTDVATDNLPAPLQQQWGRQHHRYQTASDPCALPNAGELQSDVPRRRSPTGSAAKISQKRNGLRQAPSTQESSSPSSCPVSPAMMPPGVVAQIKPCVASHGKRRAEPDHQEKLAPSVAQGGGHHQQALARGRDGLSEGAGVELASSKSCPVSPAMNRKVHDLTWCIGSQGTSAPLAESTDMLTVAPARWKRLAKRSSKSSSGRVPSKGTPLPATMEVPSMVDTSPVPCSLLAGDSSGEASGCDTCKPLDGNTSASCTSSTSSSLLSLMVDGDVANAMEPQGSHDSDEHFAKVSVKLTEGAANSSCPRQAWQVGHVSDDAEVKQPQIYAEKACGKYDGGGVCLSQASARADSQLTAGSLMQQPPFQDSETSSVEWQQSSAGWFRIDFVHTS